MKDYNAGFSLYYHNGMIWPFVQAYWGWAAAKVRSLGHFETELDRIVALSEKNDTYQEDYFPEDGKPEGSGSQRWTASGYLSMVYYGLFGMRFDPTGVMFAPVVRAQVEQMTLDNVRYRDMTLNISARVTARRLPSSVWTASLSRLRSSRARSRTHTRSTSCSTNASPDR